MKRGMLTFVENLGVHNKNSYSMWLCDCGRYKRIQTSSVMNGATKSCGCVRKLAFQGMNRAHFAAPKTRRSAP
jgi:hypothetical protein